MTKPKPKDALLPPVSVMVRGVFYPTVAACCKALKVRKNTVYVALHSGKPDSIGIGCGKSPNTVRRGADNGRAKGVEIGGVKFDTLRHLDDYIGMKHGYSSNALNNNRMVHLARRVMAKQADEHKKALRKHNISMGHGIEEHHYMGQNK